MLKQECIKHNISYNRVCQRIAKWWDKERALTKPVWWLSINKKIHNTHKEYCKKNWLNSVVISVIYNRLKRWRPVNKVIETWSLGHGWTRTWKDFIPKYKTNAI